MLMTILKIAAGVAVVAIIAMVLLAVVWGIASSVRERRGARNDNGPR